MDSSLHAADRAAKRNPSRLPAVWLRDDQVEAARAQHLVQAFGVNVPVLLTLTYGLGAGLAGLAGILAAPVYQVSPLMGSNLIIVVFAVVVVGGMGSILGAIVTGYMLPTRMAEGLVTEFLLVKDPAMCCYGAVPNMNEWVVVKMTKGVRPLMDVPISFSGEFKVGALFENGYMTGIYLLEGEKMENRG